MEGHEKIKAILPHFFIWKINGGIIILYIIISKQRKTND